VRGVETDFSIRPTDNLTAYVNAAYTDHEYVRFVDAPCPPELSGGTVATGTQVPGAPGVPGALSPANCDISGQWLPGISKWALSYGAQYEFGAGKLLGRDGHAYVGFDGSYRTKWSSNPSRSAYTDVSGYALANFRVGFREEDRWDVYAWLRNAFDKEYFDFLSVPSGNTGLISGQPGDQRTWGATIQVHF
jgi:iron complex outermembrane receptor protein